MIAYNELKPGMCIEWEGSAYRVLEAEFLRMQQRKPVMKTKLKDIASGKVREISFQQSDSLEEANLLRMSAVFIYESRGEYWFHEMGNPKNRFSLAGEAIGDSARFLKKDIEIIAFKHNDAIVNVELPVKVELLVVEAPPSIKGDTASGGSKQVVLETGAKINTPFFVQEGDIVRVNTQTGEYVERVQKS